MNLQPMKDALSAERTPLVTPSLFMKVSFSTVNIPLSSASIAPPFDACEFSNNEFETVKSNPE